MENNAPETEIVEEKISINDITIDEIITCIRDIMGEYTCSSEKIGKIKNFVGSIDLGDGETKAKVVQNDL